MSKQNNLGDIRPDYYKSKGLEVIDVIKVFGSDLSGVEAFYFGNILKYLCRFNKKNGVEDLRKARTYLDLLISQREEQFLNNHSNYYRYYKDYLNERNDYNKINFTNPCEACNLKNNESDQEESINPCDFCYDGKHKPIEWIELKYNDPSKSFDMKKVDELVNLMFAWKGLTDDEKDGCHNKWGDLTDDEQLMAYYRVLDDDLYDHWVNDINKEDTFFKFFRS